MSLYRLRYGSYTKDGVTYNAHSEKTRYVELTDEEYNSQPAKFELVAVKMSETEIVNETDTDDDPSFDTHGSLGSMSAAVEYAEREGLQSTIDRVPDEIADTAIMLDSVLTWQRISTMNAPNVISLLSTVMTLVDLDAIETVERGGQNRVGVLKAVSRRRGQLGG